MKIIKLTQGYETAVDDSDYVWLSQWKWHYNKGYAVRGDYSTGKLKIVYMHRIVMKPPKDMVIDHISGKTLDNQQNNLRIVTKSQNQCNRGKTKNNKSKYKGVNFHKASGKWQVAIGINGKRIHLGLFTTPELAAEAYKQANIKLHGEYGRV